MDGYLAQILMWACPWVPRNWALCDGQLLSIADFTALYSLIGTNYGGDGITTFGLPDFRGRMPLGAGTGPGLSPRLMGQRFGSERNILQVEQLPTFSAEVQGTTSIQIPGQSASTAPATSDTPNENNSSILAKFPTFELETEGGEEELRVTGYTDGASNCSLRSPGAASGTINGQTTPIGNSYPINNMPPIETVKFIICVEGIYPSRP